MEKRKKILLKFLFPPIPLVIFSALVSAGLLIYSFIGEDVPKAAKYGSYFLSAYALTILCAAIPCIYRTIHACRKENPYVVLYRTDTKLRMKISLYCSVGFNCAYALMHAVSGVYEHSVWFYALAGYYGMLAAIRGLLLRDVRTGSAVSTRSQWKKYRLCGILLAAMNLVLTAIVFCIVLKGRGFQYHSIHTIAMAAYTFTVTAMAIVNAVRYRKYRQPLLSAGKAVSVAAALVSMLSLETAMLHAFGSENSESFRQTMTFFTGTGVCTLVLVIGIYMIVRSTKALRKPDSGCR